MVGEDSLYLSRCELVRKSIENRLIEFIRDAKENTRPDQNVPEETEEAKVRRFVRESQQKAKNLFNESENH